MAQIVHKSNLRLWATWAATNGIAELLGLGATAVIDFFIIWRASTGRSMAAILLGILLVTASGAVEGAVVGLLQWNVLYRRLPTVSRRRWMAATIVGAMVAWFFGSLPSMIMDMGAQASGEAVQEPRQASVLLLAAAMGLGLGAILAYPQWRVLRGVVRRAWLWLPANGVAWALGMPIVFATIDVAQPHPLGLALLVAAAGLLVTGLIVGAVHGLALVELVGQPTAPDVRTVIAPGPRVG